MSVSYTPSVLVHDASELDPQIIPSGRKNVLLRFVDDDHGTAVVVFADTPAALSRLLIRAVNELKGYTSARSVRS